ncbi:MAG: cysT [Solirubrobacterales bacterium]|nr:cysT [Solirubrobacterales bacterium]
MLGLGIATVYLSLLVLLPLAAVAAKAVTPRFWDEVTSPAARSALELTLGASLVVTAINVVFGTVVAWVLVRDEFPGKRVLNAVVDLPFALPTVVAGLILLGLYGPTGPLGIDVAYTRVAVGLALLFVTLPFVVRAVQPVLAALDREAEDAAQTLGASGWQTFRRVVLPALRPAIVSGAALGFARAVGEFGSIVLISGNIPLKTQVASVLVFGQIESDDVHSAAAVSVVLLLLALLVLLFLRGLNWRHSRHGA